MNVSITARHCRIPAPIREHAEQRLQRLVRYDRRLRAAEVIFDRDRGERRVEARLFVNRGHAIIAHASASTFAAALDRLSDRLRRQLKRRRELRRQYQSVRLSELQALPAGGA